MVLGRFRTTLRHDTCLRVMTKKSLFSCFLVIFMSYCPQFLSSRRIFKPRKNTYIFKRLRDMTRNSSFSCFMAVFMSYGQLFWGSRAIYNDLKTQHRIESYAKKLVVFVVVAI